MTEYKLSQDAACAGCAAKLNQSALQNILKSQDFYQSENIVIGIENFDDAGVYKMKDGSYIVQSTDFFPPIVDDPFQFGQIAAANALSDIYAMGAKPITALNICCFPGDKYPAEVYGGIIEGSSERLRSAKCDLLGGHTIEDPELKFGIAVTGITDKSKLITNNQAKAGDILFLTKPLGTGIITTALKCGLCPQDSIKQAIDSMIKLNDEARDIMIKYSVKTATDITGFGLAGHALEICKASKVNMLIYLDKLPVFTNVFNLLNMGMLPAGSHKNKEINLPCVDLNDNTNSDIIFDAQTSGGVLMAVPPDKADDINKLQIAAEIGKVLEKDNSEKLLKIV